jgi:hypothetical protein
MSSKEAMPDDVRMVEDENGEVRVAAGRPTVLELVFLLKVDMGVSALDYRRTGGGGRNCHLISYHDTTKSPSPS